MAAFEKTSIGDEKWAPSFGRTGGAPMARPARSKAPLFAALGVAGAAANGGGVWYYQNTRGTAPPAPPPTRARAQPTTTTTPAIATQTTPPVASQPAGPASTTATQPPATPPAPVAPPRDGGPLTLVQARTLMRQGQLPQAARGFQANVKSAPAGTLSVQLLVACAPETVQKAVDGVHSDELFILPVNYKGRDCFRMCWGLYANQARATAAMRALPEYFRVGGATPKVLPVATLLP
jgi:hypothetical protein